MNFSFEDFKLYCFHNEYNKYNNIINRMQMHINALLKNNIIGVNERNIHLSDIYKIITEINNIKKCYISMPIAETESDIESENENHNLEHHITNDDLSEICKKIISNFVASDNEYSQEDLNELLYNHLMGFINIPTERHAILDKVSNDIKISYLLNRKILFPLDNIKQSICEFAKNIGVGSLSDVLFLYNADSMLFEKTDAELFDLYDEIFIPLHVIAEPINTLNHTDLKQNTIIDPDITNNSLYSEKIYFKTNNEQIHEELLDNKFDLFLTTTTYRFRIMGYFRLDSLQIDIRLMIPSKYSKLLYKKIEIDNQLHENDRFKKKYLKYCSVQELVTLTVPKFKEYLETKHRKFNDINNKSFPSLMKDFIGKNVNLLSWYETIKLLLLGSDENINVAGSLFSLLKDKKTNVSLVPDIIYDNLVFCNQMKLKKINQTLKVELEKLSEINMDSVDLKKKLACSTNIPLAVRAFAMEKVAEMKTNSNDYYKQLTYVKTIMQFPWPSLTDDNIFQSYHNNRSDARNFIKKIDSDLDKITYGHKDVKKTIGLEITKWISNPSSSGTAIGLLGPPGVGKTLIAKSLSKVLDIPMVMITLGGQNDAELMVGHGYTYSGAQPGLIVKKMCEAGKGRCIMFFDELDKSCAKHGSVNEITSILIHLTDPNTNKNFQDRFFQGVDLPMDKVIFMFSYNDADKIDHILLDRIKEIEVKSYNIEDKINILRDFIIPELKTNVGFKKEIIFEEDDMKKFIYGFTNEAGVRGLKSCMETIMLNINRDDIISDMDTDTTSVKLTYDLIVKYLGEKNKNHRKKIPTTNKVGHINGLYATATGGGGLTNIEITPMKTGEKTQFFLTGSMGDVMKESIRIAYTNAIEFIAQNVDLFGITDIDKHLTEKFPHGFHIHTPEGATPKDGPSAGTAFTMGFISVITNTAANRFVAMTGETNLSHQVTKIGGLVYKLIGAKYAGVKLALVPKENEPDIAEIKSSNPGLIKGDFNVVCIETLHDAFKHVLMSEHSESVKIRDQYKITITDKVPDLDL